MTDQRSSEQIAFDAYKGLDPARRHVVDAWRALGCDWSEAVVNSRAVSEVLTPRRPPIGDVWTTRHAPRTPEMTRRLAAEHEAAHAVVASALGVPVVEVSIDERGGGETIFEAASAMDSATIAVAAEIWVDELRWRTYPGGDRGCSGDRRQLARHVDDFGARQACTRARAILRDNADAVLALADRLEEESRLTYSGRASRGTAPPPRPPRTVGLDQAGAR